MPSVQFVIFGAELFASQVVCFDAGSGVSLLRKVRVLPDGTGSEAMRSKSSIFHVNLGHQWPA